MNNPEPSQRPAGLLSPTARKGWILLIIVMAATFALSMLIMSIGERRREAALPAQLITPISENEPDSEVWGRNFPREYESFLRTAEMEEPTKHGGSQPFDHLERNPRLRDLFAGYPFSIEYKDDRGHMYSLQDVRETARIDPSRGGVAQPGTCLTCKSSDVPQMMADMGVHEFYKTPFEVLNKKASHPVGCADCHDPKTMNLRITRPALREAFTAMGRDIDKATHQEMRSLVCAQCHVEYYFSKQPGDERASYLVFPWKRGVTIEQIEEFYTKDVRHVDWIHPVSKTEMIKMQHPDWELFQAGIHAQRGVACADCHMPYRSEGSVKFTDHHIRSPLMNTQNTCGVCHRFSEEEATTHVYRIQDSTKEIMDRAELALVAAHKEIRLAMDAGATDDQLAEARELIRRAQMRWDFVLSSNGMGFHAPQESARILASAIDLAQEARLKVMRLNR